MPSTVSFVALCTGGHGVMGGASSSRGRAGPGSLTTPCLRQSGMGKSPALLCPDTMAHQNGLGARGQR
jgi:hypothetical protein